MSCFCVDSQTGVEVDGSRGPFPSCNTKTAEPEPVAAKNCLRIKEEALVFNKKVSDSGPFASSFADLKFVPSCNGDGSYKALQCDDKAKSCRCADRMGVEISNTRKATGGVFKSAPPDCSAQARVVNEFASQTPCERIKARGIHQNLVCDRKGFFEKVQIRMDEDGKEIKYCADPETGYPRVKTCFDSPYLTDFRKTTTITWRHENVSTGLPRMLEVPHVVRQNSWQC